MTKANGAQNSQQPSMKDAMETVARSIVKQGLKRFNNINHEKNENSSSKFAQKYVKAIRA